MYIGANRRWILLAGATIVMMFIAIYQHSWSLFALGLNYYLEWPIVTIQIAFTFYVYASTLIQPLSGYFADKFGSRNVAIFAGLLVVFGFLLNYTSSSPAHLYIYYTLGSIGVGVLYGISTAIAVKWFPDKRGLAAGIVTFGFGAGTALFNVILQSWILKYGVKIAFLYTGILMLIFIIPFTFLYTYPEKEQDSEEQRLGDNGNTINWKWHEMIKTRQWWLIYTSFIIVSAIVLLFSAQVALMAKVNNIPEDILSIVLTSYPLANGLSRVLGGLLSDHIGRQTTATAFYSMAGIMMVALSITATNPIGFTLFITLAALFAGAVFAFSPALIGDFYGPKYSTTNYGITYTAKMWGGLISGYIMTYFVAEQNNCIQLITWLGVGSLMAGALVNPLFLKKPQKSLRIKN